MATMYWQGGATAVAQVTNVTVGGTIGTQTWTILVGGKTIASYTSTGVDTASTIATALIAAWNLSTHPYATGIEASSGGTGIVTLTGDVPGVPFVLTLSTPGSGGTLSQATATAATGPNHWDNAQNWSGGAVPNITDTAIVDSGPNICWGLNTVSWGGDATEIRITRNFTGRIGLDDRVFATSSDGLTATTAIGEYRATHLQFRGPANVGIDVGQSSTATGSGRIRLEQLSSSSGVITVFGSASASVDAGRPAVAIKATNASTVLNIRQAPGGIGVAIEPGATTTIGTLNLLDTSTATKLTVGPGTTVTTLVLNGGTNQIQAAATVTTLTVRGGVTTLDGSWALTTLNLYGGTLRAGPQSAGTITTANLYGGEFDLSSTRTARAITTANFFGGDLLGDFGVVTSTTRTGLVKISSL